MKYKRFLVFLFTAVWLQEPARAQGGVPPYDLWTPQVMSRIRDRSTLELSVTARDGYYDVFFTSNPSAGWFEDQPPYTEHRNEKIRIHAYLTVPPYGSGPAPALVLGHGHTGQADRSLAQMIATLGYVCLAIDGPRAGQSTGGPRDTSQAWISVDKGPEYSFLYHWAYAGMRALTALEELAAASGNPYKIDGSRFGMLGASMGGLLTTFVNGIDSRVKAAIAIVAAGSWPAQLRLANSWLYNAIYTETRDLPYNGTDPLNSIEDVDQDSTVLTFLNYFDPIRYTPRQNAPLLMVIGTHDEYFPMPAANVTLMAIGSAGTNPLFEKRLWLLPNGVHNIENSSSLLPLAMNLKQWLDFCFAGRARPLATPTVALKQDGSNLRLEVSTAETGTRLSGARAEVYAGVRIDNTTTTVQDFKTFTATREGDLFVVRIPAGETSSNGVPLKADNLLYFATLTDGSSLPVSSLLYRAGEVLDLSSPFTVANRHTPDNQTAVPVPPAVSDAAVQWASSVPSGALTAYQGIALSNPGADYLAVRMEARTAEGRLASGEGLINPVYLPLPAGSQKVFVLEEWFGAGGRKLDGGFQLGWSRATGAGLGFRGDVSPSELEGIGPLPLLASPVWVPLIPDQDPAAARRLRIAAGSAGKAAELRIVFRNAAGTVLETRTATVPAGGSVRIAPPSGTGTQAPASAEIQSNVAVAARLEVSGARDPWSADGQQPATPEARTLVQPHAELNGTFGSRLVLVNCSTASRSATVRFSSTGGSTLGTAASRTIPAGGTLSETVESLLGSSVPAARDAGWFRVELSSGEVLGYVLAADPKTGAKAASALKAAVAGSWLMPFYVENSGYYTGLAIGNPSASPAEVTVIAYGSGGSETARSTQSLGPGQSRTALVSQWIAKLPAESTGYLVITGGSPLALLSYFGTLDGASLAAIPFSAR